MRERLLKRLISRASEVSLEEFNGSVLVLAPHFDDEVLGCGGTTAMLAGAGIDVHIWFLTDGGKSHSHLISEDQLKAMRMKESYRATSLLGIPADNVRAWEFPDSSLTARIPQAVAALRSEFNALQPTLVLAPYRHDGPADHEACSVICGCLVREASHDASILEYPVWAWHAWPWTKMQFGGRREIPGLAVQSIRGNFSLFRHFDKKVDITPFLELKRKALQEYESQMTRILPTANWRTLADIGSGTFLENCLMQYEVFSTPGSEHSKSSEQYSQ